MAAICGRGQGLLADLGRHWQGSLKRSLEGSREQCWPNLGPLACHQLLSGSEELEKQLLSQLPHWLL